MTEKIREEEGGMPLEKALEAIAEEMGIEDPDLRIYVPGEDEEPEPPTPPPGK